MKKPTTTIIKTDERIFQIENFEGDVFLCNLKHIKVKDIQYIKRLKHYFNNEFKTFGKIDLKEMIIKTR